MTSCSILAIGREESKMGKRKPQVEHRVVFGMSLHPKVAAAVDKARGFENRSSFISRILAEALKVSASR